MGKIYSRIKLLFSYGPELDAVVMKQKSERLKKEAAAKKDNLHLCFNHRQEENHSHYGESNCDYCKLLKKLKELENGKTTN